MAIIDNKKDFRERLEGKWLAVIEYGPEEGNYLFDTQAKAEAWAEEHAGKFPWHVYHITMPEPH